MFRKLQRPKSVSDQTTNVAVHDVTVRLGKLAVKKRGAIFNIKTMRAGSAVANNVLAANDESGGCSCGCSSSGKYGKR